MPNVWIYSLVSVLIVSLISFVGILTLSINTKKLRKILLYLVSFSAGALFGDAFIHLLPKIIEEVGFGLNISIYVLFGSYKQSSSTSQIPSLSVSSAPSPSSHSPARPVTARTRCHCGRRSKGPPHDLVDIFQAAHSRRHLVRHHWAGSRPAVFAAPR